MQTFLHDGMDESWLAEWVAFGFREMEAYLRRQAAFEAYCRRRYVVPSSAQQRAVTLHRQASARQTAISESAAASPPARPVPSRPP